MAVDDQGRAYAWGKNSFIVLAFLAFLLFEFNIRKKCNSFKPVKKRWLGKKNTSFFAFIEGVGVNYISLRVQKVVCCRWK